MPSHHSEVKRKRVYTDQLKVQERRFYFNGGNLEAVEINGDDRFLKYDMHDPSHFLHFCRIGYNARKFQGSRSTMGWINEGV